MDNKNKFKDKIKFPDKITKQIKKCYIEDKKNVSDSKKNDKSNNEKKKSFQNYESSTEKINERKNIHLERIDEKLKREIILAMKEENKLPMEKPFSKRIPLKLMVYYYNKYWNNDLTDSDCSSSDSDNDFEIELKTNLKGKATLFVNNAIDNNNSNDKSEK